MKIRTAVAATTVSLLAITGAAPAFAAPAPAESSSAHVVAAYPSCDHATVSEVVLVPGPTALLAPAWVPWENRVKPGDLVCLAAFGSGFTWASALIRW